MIETRADDITHQSLIHIMCACIDLIGGMDGVGIGGDVRPPQIQIRIYWPRWLE